MFDIAVRNTPENAELLKKHNLLWLEDYDAFYDSSIYIYLSYNLDLQLFLTSSIAYHLIANNDLELFLITPAELWKDIYESLSVKSS